MIWGGLLGKVEGVGVGGGGFIGVLRMFDNRLLVKSRFLFVGFLGLGLDFDLEDLSFFYFFYHK